MPRVREEKAIVLDFLKHGYSEDSRPLRQKESIIQAIGKDHFVLVELVPRPDNFFKPHDEVYIGEEKREQIKFIKGILSADKLTQTSRTELPFIVEKLVDANEERFVEFFNRTGPVSLRSHSLELLPGIGKKHAQLLVAERQKQPFISFEDIAKRVTAVTDPRKLIIQRVIDEIEEKDRHRLFVGV